MKMQYMYKWNTIHLLRKMKFAGKFWELELSMWGEVAESWKDQNQMFSLVCSS